jgi:MoxR-like ATPase
VAVTSRRLFVTAWRSPRRSPSTPRRDCAFDMLRLNRSNTRMSAQVLVLHGSPGFGKTTLAEVIAERLRQANLSTR